MAEMVRGNFFERDREREIDPSLLRGYKHKSLPLECRVYRPEDLCPLLGIGRSTAYELVNRRDFPTIRVGRKILIPRDAFEKWLEAQTAEAFSQEA